MRDWTKFPTMVWRTGVMRDLGDDSTRYLFCYCLTSPHQTRVGCFHLPALYAAADLGWEVPAVEARLSQIEGCGVIARDTTTDEIFVTEWFDHNGAANDRDAKGCRKAIEQIVSKKLRQKVTEAFNASEESRPPDELKSKKVLPLPKMNSGLTETPYMKRREHI